VARDIKVHLLKTELHDRSLWFDGQSSFDPDRVLELIQRYDINFVDRMTPTIAEYNRQVQQNEEIRVKLSCKPLKFDWTIPAEYKNLDVVDYVATKHNDFIADCTDEEVVAREKRLVQEMYKYKEQDLFDVLRTIIFVINTLTDNNIVWGVGRGSSVSSYVLYVIGVHDVDSFAYDLNIDEFLHN